MNRVRTMRRPAPVDPRKELLASIDGLAKRGGITRDRAITAWYATVLLGIDEDDAIDAASTDGPEDGGCDFIYIDDDQETIYVLQGYVADRPERAPGIKKWNALLGAISSVRDPVSFQHGGRSDIYERLKDVEGQGYSLAIGLVTLAAKSDQIARQLQTTVRARTYGADVSFFYEYQETLHDKYLIAKAADRNVSDDTLEFVGAPVEVKGEFGTAVVGAVKASELARLHQKYDNQLFEGNVRLYIGQRKGGINEKILETAKARPGDFWALNNGITIVSDSFEALTDQKFRLRNFSVVNGCQTTVSVSRALLHSDESSKLQLLVRVVGAKKALITDIVRFNNTQNPVKLAAVRLLDPVQESLRGAFQTIGFTYAPKQEGAKTVKSPKRIELDKITQYLAAMTDDTVLEAVARKGELFDRSYRLVFPRGLKPERVYMAWHLGQQVEAARIELLDEVAESDAVTRGILGIHGTPWGIFVASWLVDQLGTDMSKLTLKKMATPDFENAVRKYARLAVELYSEIAVTLVGDAAGANVRNEIRVKSFLDKLKRLLGLRLAKLKRSKHTKLHMVSSS